MKSFEMPKMIFVPIAAEDIITASIRCPVETDPVPMN